MKKFIIALFVLANSQGSYAQRGLEFTATLSPGISTILNKEDLKASYLNEAQTSVGFEARLTVGHNFTDYVGLASGIGMAYIEQNYIQPESKELIKAFHYTSDRQLSYFRIPLLLRVGSDPAVANGFFMRFGPHLDLLMTAVGTTQFPLDYNLPDERMDYKANVDYYGKKTEVFSPAVFGLSLEMGVKIGLTEKLGLLIMGHVESSLSNVDGEAAPAYFESTSKLVKRRFGYSSVNERSQTFNLMGGLSIGLQYAPNAFAHRVGRGSRSKGYKFHKWN